MTAIAGLDAKTDLTGVVVGGVIREDLLDRLYDISRVDLPYSDRARRGSVSAASFDWVRQRARAAADNAYVETAEFATTGAAGVTAVVDGAHAPLNRYRNHVQVSSVGVSISQQALASNSIGGSAADQLGLANVEIRQDIEYMIVGRNQATVVGNGASTAPRAGSYLCFVDVNWNGVSTNDLYVSVASASPSSEGGWNSSTYLFEAATIGTPTAAPLAESDIRDMIQTMYKMGAADPGKMMTCMSAPEIKRVISEYYYTSTAKAAPLIKTSGEGPDQRAVGSVTVIDTDFATLELVPNRFMSTFATGCYGLFIFDPNWQEIVWQKGITATKQGQSGLVDRWLLSGYWSLRPHPETMGAIMDISTGAMTAT